MCREVEYRFTVLAYIKNITYHDYGTVDPAEILQVRALSTAEGSQKWYLQYRPATLLLISPGS